MQELAGSIRELGLLNPVTVDKDCRLIAGLHRLEAVKLLGLSMVECTVSSLEGLKAELAEIDENIVRSGIPAVEYGEVLLQRKEIYETLHPELRATYEGGAFTRMLALMWGAWHPGKIQRPAGRRMWKRKSGTYLGTVH